MLREDHPGGEQRPGPSVRGDRDNPYQESARSDQQPKILDFVPRRAGIIFVLFLLQLNCLAALQSLHWAFYESSARMDQDWLSYFNMGRDGSLASWLIAVWFLVAAGLCGVLFSIRRHRRDDFQGRYRVWAWLSALLVAMSACAVSGFDGFAGEVVRRLAPEMGPLARVEWSSLEWSVALVTLVTAVVSARMWFDFRESRAATCLVAMTLAVFGLAAVYRLEWLSAGPFEVRWLSVSLGTMGATLLVVSCFVFCRFVILDAHGEIQRRESRQSRRLAAAENEPASEPGNEVPTRSVSEGRSSERGTAATRAEKENKAKKENKSENEKRAKRSDRNNSVVAEAQTQSESVDTAEPAETERRSPLGGRRKNREQPAGANQPSVRIQSDTIQQPNSDADAADADLTEEELAQMSKADRRRHRKQRKRRAA